jgi:hypothetical protein
MHRLKNRIVISLIVIFMATYFWEFYVKPVSGPLYTSAVAEYKGRNYERSIKLLQEAYRIDPNDTSILMLFGWNYLKLGKPSVAIPYLTRSLRLDPSLDEARLGLAYSCLEMEDGAKALEYFNQLPPGERDSPEVLVAEARAYRLLGDNRQALKLASIVLRIDRANNLARKEVAYLTGSEGMDETTPGQANAVERPSQLIVPVHVQNGFFQIFQDGNWKKMYVAGVDIGPATPGHFASEPPTDINVYLDWLDKIDEAGANCVRVYSILPPAFYRALRMHNEAPNSTKLYLLQGIWLGGGEETDVFSASREAAAREEITNAVDVIHGRGDLPIRRGFVGGLYSVDVSNYVLGFLLEREIPPHWVLANNRDNAQVTSYAGKYVSLENGNATEVWVARMMDLAESHEVDQYNYQHPIAFANSPALDPIAHPSESSLSEEIAIRQDQGERTATLPPDSKDADDNDAVSIDETKFHVEEGFQAGIFSAYGVFPFYPDFMYRDPSYLTVRDRQGPDPFLGYLKALKNHYAGMALLIAEYGVPTGMGISHLHPLGWNDGGETEQEQADLIGRMSRNISEAGCAGGMIYEWQDEWYRANWLAGALALPIERRPLWNNRLDPDQGFGLWTYDPERTRSLFGEFSGWDAIPRLYQKGATPNLELHDGWDAERTLRSLAVSSDESFVYVRLEVGHVRNGANNLPNTEGAHYFIGISTDSGNFGSRTLPGLVPRVRTESGANFLLDLGEDGRARLLIASDYNFREFQSIYGAGSSVQSSYRVPFTPYLADWSGFEEILVEPNRRRFARDGHVFPSQLYNESLLRYAPAGSTQGSEANWTCDFTHNAYIFRLPWELLMVMDPSSHQVYAGTEKGPRFTGVETPGLVMFVASFRAIGPIHFQQLRGGGTPAVDTLPALDNQGTFKGMPTYGWPGWNEVKVQGRPKKAYTSLEKLFHELRGPSS